MKKPFWPLTILYFGAIILGIYGMVEAYKQKNDFNLFFRGVLVLLWTGYLINRIRGFYKNRNKPAEHNNH